MLEIQRELLKPEIRDISIVDAIAILNNIPIREKIIREASVKGQSGEREIFEMISETNFIVEKSPHHSADFVVWKTEFPAIKILIEVKNYAGVVPREQYDKFMDDISSTGLCGIFVSKTSVANHDFFEIYARSVLLVGFDHLIPILELFWTKILHEKTYKFAGSDLKLMKSCREISCAIEKTIQIKNSADLMLKVIKRETKNINEICSEIIFDAREELLVMSAIISGEEVKILSEFKINDPFVAGLKGLKADIEKLVREMFAKPRIVAGKNLIEISGEEKILQLKFFKTKLVISFKSKKLNDSFTEFEFCNGMISIAITKKNYSSNFVPKILAFVI